MLHGGGLDDVGRALARGDAEAIANARLRAVARWALNTRSPDHPAVVDPPFDERSAPEFVGTAVAFHTTNRIVDVFLEASPIAMPSGLKWTAALLTKPVASTFAHRLCRMQRGRSFSSTWIDGAEKPWGRVPRGSRRRSYRLPSRQDQRHG